MKLATVMLALSAAVIAPPVLAAPADAPFPATRPTDTIPAQLSNEQRAGYRAVFQAIHDRKWLDARLQLAQMPQGPLHDIALAEIYTGKGSPRVEAADLAKLLATGRDLPEADYIARLARARGATDLPELPYVRALSWVRGAPVRTRVKSTARSDAIAADLAVKMQPFIKADDGASAQALLESTEGLSPEALTEWQHKVAWIYYIAGDDANARAMAAKAAAGTGDWAVQADWASGLAAWRQHDCKAAGSSFDTVVQRTADVELRAAALYWSSRAQMMCGHPEQVEPRLRSAAQYDETFYGLLARETLGLKMSPFHDAPKSPRDDWKALDGIANVRTAAALAEIGEADLAGDVLKHQAKIGDPDQFAALVRLAGALNLPDTQIWLAHNAPTGAAIPASARYPSPNWTPDGGWRVDKALVYAHTLQESNFRANAVSAAGAYGLMQVRAAAASDMARKRGLAVDRAMLTQPSVNIEIGQSYLEMLRDQSATGGLLPKVIAAYNAGPLPVATWNSIVHDGGDPLLYIESIPYWETRGYVVTVLRNYWVYERESGRDVSPSRSALAQGMWPRFPGLPGPSAVRVRAADTATLQPVQTASAN